MVGLQEQLATGKRLRKPSDDPVDVANATKLRTKSTQLQQYKRNIEDGLAVMGVASSAMMSMNELLHRSKELAIQAANGTYTDGDRLYMQQEVDQLFRQMMSIVNTQFKGNYVFNGTNTKIPPYIIASSASELPNYTQRTMATYGTEFDINLQSTAADNPLDTIYLDHSSSSYKIGDRVQLRWNTDDPGSELNGQAVNNVMHQPTDTSGPTPVTPPLPFGTMTVLNSAGIPVTFTRGADADYEVDHRSGEVIVISEAFRDAINRATVEIDRDQKGEDFNYSLVDTFKIVDGKFGNPNDPNGIKNIFPGSFTIKIGDKQYIEGYGEYKPGTYDENGVYHKGENEFDYQIDYETGKITVFNMDLMRDMRPDWLLDFPNQLLWQNSPENPYNPGQLRIDFDYITRGIDVYGSPIVSHGDILRAIEEGITVPINIRADEMLFDPKSGTDMIGVLLRYSQALLKDDREAIQHSIQELDNMYNVVLNAQSQLGATIFRLELTMQRNEQQQVEVLEQRSKLEDADLAEIISKLMLSEAIYNASLQAAMRVLQPTLANYM